jgi:hypothetical protein
MSAISTVYDAIISSTETLFPSKLRIHNPYELSDNPEITMKDSWGLRVLDSAYVEFEFCKLSMIRDYSFLLIRQFATVGNKDDAFDTVSKDLLEDQQSFLNMIYSPQELGQHSEIDKVDIASVTGIEFVQSNQKKYLFCEIKFRITMSAPIQ